MFFRSTTINNSSGKRKIETKSSVTNYDSLEENIKRCRISNTPGELRFIFFLFFRKFRRIKLSFFYVRRLQKDIKELRDMIGIRIESTIDPATIIIFFESNDLPNKFSVNVTRYYPHAHPIVVCLSPRPPGCHFIDNNGLVIHSSLMECWSAVHSLRNVVEVINTLRIVR
jgi:hypothetical protein